MSSEPSRLFFALWPEPELQQAFFESGQALSKLCGGRLTRREDIHLTLVFLGAVEAQHLPGVLAVAAQTRLSNFEMCFDRLGWWRQNQVAWAASTETPRPLLDLVKALQRGLVLEGFKFDERRYVPHVSLLRKAQCRDTLLESASIAWSVQQFALVNSTLHPGGPHYSIVQRWPLSA